MKWSDVEWNEVVIFAGGWCGSGRVMEVGDEEWKWKGDGRGDSEVWSELQTDMEAQVDTEVASTLVQANGMEWIGICKRG